MSIQNLLNQFIGTGNSAPVQNLQAPGFAGRLSKFTGNIPGGLIGGAAAGSILSLLLSNKSARKFASTAATYGGAALLGGIAYKAYKNWQHSQHKLPPGYQDYMAFLNRRVNTPNFELKLIKAMIAAAKADGHIDDREQLRIFNAIGEMELPLEARGMMFDLLRRPVTISEICEDVTDTTQKSELYLVTCLVIDPDHPTEKAHLDKLAQSLELPDGLTQEIRMQAQRALTEAH